MQSFLQGFRPRSKDEYSNNSNSVSAMQQSTTANIIVESNFKVYAYTDSVLYRAILELFMRVDYILPNLFVGMLTRESLKKAFKKKITTS